MGASIPTPHRPSLHLGAYSETNETCHITRKTRDWTEGLMGLNAGGCSLCLLSQTKHHLTISAECFLYRNPYCAEHTHMTYIRKYPPLKAKQAKLLNSC